MIITKMMMNTNTLNMITTAMITMTMTKITMTKITMMFITMTIVVGQEPQQQAVFFYRRLLRAESYRKALVWQKRLIIIILRYHDCGRDPSLRYRVRGFKF